MMQEVSVWTVIRAQNYFDKFPMWFVGATVTTKLPNGKRILNRISRPDCSSLYRTDIAIYLSILAVI